MKLGAIYSKEKTTFTLFSPVADSVFVIFYDKGNDSAETGRLEMMRGEGELRSIFSVTAEGNLDGVYYTYEVHTSDGTFSSHDPYARACGVNGHRSMVIDLSKTNPYGFADEDRPKLADPMSMVITEVSVADVSAGASAHSRYPGKFKAFTEDKTLSYFKDMGVTHLQLMPSYDFASIDESDSLKEQYNWGYDPYNYNVPEGSYSTDPFNGAVRVREYKEMVHSIHEAGLGVIMDVVYNHTFVGDGSNFSLTVPGYFYRHKPDGSYSDASGCGNETASERAMVRRYIVESVKYWAEEYHVDGFRFDLMGIHDVETMNEVKAELTKLDPSIFVYGEGWTASDSPLPEDQRAIKVNAPKLNDVAVFSDDLRDALKGSVFETTQAGFASGKPEGNEESIKFGIVGAIRHPQIDYNQILYCKAPYANKPTQVINYVSCHDDLCLMDKLKLSAPKDATPDELIRFGKLAQTIIFTSQGVPFMRAGEELLHDKKGVHNSYQSPDSINEIDWSLKAKNKDVFNYYKDLIALRKSHPAFRIATAEGVREALQFQEVNQPGVVAYTLGEHANGDSWKKIMVIFNGNRKAVTVSLPEGTWIPVCKDGRIYLDGKGSVQGKTTVSASSALILKQD